MSLNGRKIAILLAPKGTEEREFTEPKAAVTTSGADLTVVGIEPGEGVTVNHDLEPGGRYKVDQVISEVSASDFDGLIIPGGSVGSDKLRGNKEIVALVHSFFEQGKPVGVICHGPWLLVEADVVNGRTLTSYPTVATDIRNAGGKWVDKEVVVDQGLVTSRNPDDLPAFCRKIVEEFEEGRHPAQARSA